MGDPWPSVRGPQREGWLGLSKDGVRRTQMDAGPKKKRVESTAIGAVESLPFKWTAADAALVEAHYEANKALRFSFPHPVWGTVEAEYDAPIKWSEKGPWRLATVQLEIFR
jgi:hypothetical protein